MISDVIAINQFVLQKEISLLGEDTRAECAIEEQGVAFVFYDSGQVNLDVKYGSRTDELQFGSGLAASFFCNEEVTFIHKISGKKPLRSVCISSSIGYLEQLIEANFLEHGLGKLLHPQDDFVLGSSFYMNHAMHCAVNKIFNSTYSGAIGDLFLESQTLELLAHYLELSTPNNRQIAFKKQDRDRLYFAKDILLKKMEKPPSLKQLAKLVGLNEYKLKKGFKQLFGVPVYKYLQGKRLENAHNLLIDKEISVQQAAYSVGYESLSSFSNAFLEKYGYRPSKVGK